MARFGAKQANNRKNTVLSVIIFVVLLTVLLFAVVAISDDSLDEQQQNLEQALTQGAVHCYATEGSYPESLDDLLERYNITYDESSFIISYQVSGENMMPEIRVIRTAE